MDYKQLYEKTIKEICEKDAYSFDTIVELPKPSFDDKTIENENAPMNALYRYKLDETKATDQDYKDFVEYIYAYIGKEDELPTEISEEQPMEQNNEKIKKLLAKYGADEEEIKNFMQDLAEMKDDIEEMGDMQQDENKGQDEYNDFAENNNLDENDNKLKEIAKDEKQHEDFLLNAQNVALLKATQEGKELLINAPTMAKDELEKAIKEYLLKNKGE